MSVLFHNNATTTLSAGASDSATSISVVDGSAFPAISGSDYLYLTLEADSDSSLKEIVKCTARSGNTLTVVRGQDNSTARSFSSGDKCELRLTAAGLNDVATQADTDTTYTAGSGLSLTGTEFANTAPDQTVALTGAGATSISGTYPNFTITSTDTNTDTNTTYTAGTGITLTGTEFSIGQDVATTASPTFAAINVNGLVTSDDFQIDLGTSTAAVEITTPSSLTGFNAFSIKNTHTEGYLSFGTALGQARIKATGASGSADPLDIDVGSTTAIGIDASGNLSFSGDITATTGNYSTGADQNTFTTPHGNIQLGPMNTSHAHIYTDRPNFYFNKQLKVLGDDVITSSTAQPSQIAIRNGSPTLYLRDTNNNSAMLHCNSDIFYVLRGGDDTTTWSQVNGAWPLEINLTNNNATFGGQVHVKGNLDMASDSNTAARYVNLPRGGGITFYGNGNVDHSITSRNSGGTATDDLFMQSYGGIFLGLDSNNNNSSSADFKIVTNGNSTARLTFSGENYGLTVSGNVTAYSDRRLKDDIQPIEDALEKVGTLSGNTYLRNDLPETDTERRYAGVIAQEVEVVLPEAVSESEDGTKTVDYNAVIALLVESIKELKAEVEELKGNA